MYALYYIKYASEPRSCTQELEEVTEILNIYQPRWTGTKLLVGFLESVDLGPFKVVLCAWERGLGTGKIAYPELLRAIH